MPQSLADLLADVDRVQLPGLMWSMFLAGLVEVIFPPFPGDAAFLAGGFIAGRRGFPVIWPLLAACLGTYLAAAALVFIGRFGGRPLLSRRLFARLLPEAKRGQVESWFDRYGLWAVMFSRFVPIVRSGIALAAGMAAFSPLRALLSLAVGVALFNSLLVFGGSLAGERWQALVALFAAFGWILLVAAFAAVLIRFLTRRRAR